MKKCGVELLGLCLISIFYSCQTAAEIKQKQYFVEGLELYKTHCANCHQLDGTGLAGLYPPISNSDFLKGNKLKMICIMHNGLNDSLVVNGKRYTQKMPANKALEPLDLAEITTYVYNKWGDETVITNLEDVEKAFEKCKN
jgi:mono/diheme cytochrome c family protein